MLETLSDGLFDCWSDIHGGRSAISPMKWVSELCVGCQNSDQMDSIFEKRYWMSCGMAIRAVCLVSDGMNA